MQLMRNEDLEARTNYTRKNKPLGDITKSTWRQDCTTKGRQREQRGSNDVGLYLQTLKNQDNFVNVTRV